MEVQKKQTTKLYALLGWTFHRVYPIVLSVMQYQNFYHHSPQKAGHVRYIVWSTETRDQLGTNINHEPTVLDSGAALSKCSDAEITCYQVHAPALLTRLTTIQFRRTLIYRLVVGKCPGPS